MSRGTLSRTEAGSATALWLSLADEMSGAEHSLLELLAHTPGNHAVAAPPGRFGAHLRAGGHRPQTLPAWSPTLRGGASEWLRTSPGLWRLARGIAACARACGAAVVVGNGLRAGLAASLAGTGLPVVWALRDNVPGGAAGHLAALLARRATLVANSRFVAEQCAQRLGPEAGAVAIHPGVSWPTPGHSIRQELGLRADVPLVGVVGQLAPWKRQLDAVQAVRLARRRHPACHLLIVGEAKFRPENRAYHQRLAAEAAQDGGRTLLLGERHDLQDIYPALDALLVPSADEPFGRVAAEALGYGTPVLASAGGGLAEIVSIPARGRLLPPGDPPAWAAALDGLLDARPRLGPSEVAAVRAEFSAAAAGRRWADLLGKLAQRRPPAA